MGRHRLVPFLIIYYALCNWESEAFCLLWTLYSKHLDLKSNNDYKVKEQTISLSLRVSIPGEPYRNYSTFSTNSFVVQSLVFGPILIACNDYIKLVTRHLLDAFSVSFGCVSDYFVPNRNLW